MGTGIGNFIRGILAIYHFEAMFDTDSVLPDSVEQFETILLKKCQKFRLIEQKSLDLREKLRTKSFYHFVQFKLAILGRFWLLTIQNDLDALNR